MISASYVSWVNNEAPRAVVTDGDFTVYHGRCIDAALDELKAAGISDDDISIDSALTGGGYGFTRPCDVCEVCNEPLGDTASGEPCEPGSGCFVCNSDEDE